jgi:2-keto-4-pentenoate hydratase/2-oxohepta-3-ene-1,7-dioic acid hydratase in catechol pathway
MHLVTFQQGDLDRDGGGQGPDASRDRSGRLADAVLGFETLELLRPGTHRLGALIPPGPHAGEIVDLNRALSVKLAEEDVGAPEAEADSLLPPDMLSFLERGEAAIAIARQAFAWVQRSLGRYDGPDLLRGGVLLPRRDARLCAPVPRPGKIVGVARNYAAHAAERGAEAPEEPVLFVKASSAVIGPGDDIVLPAASERVDYEGELAVVIGRTAHLVSAQTALDHVAGYTVANDVTARDFQNTRGQRFLGKSCDTFAPMGPVLVTRDEVGDPQKLRLETRLDDKIVQSAITGEMIFGVADLIVFATRLMTLHPGDILLSGTPAGVGAAATPPRYLRDGDVVDVEIERIGQLRNHVTRGTGRG